MSTISETTHTTTSERTLPRSRSPASPTPDQVWEAWSNLVQRLLSRGVRKSEISLLSDLPATAGKARNLSRYVLYPRVEDWQAQSSQHCRRLRPPWESPRVAHQLHDAIRNLAEAHHRPEIADAARAALDTLHLSREN